MLLSNYCKLRAFADTTGYNYTNAAGATEDIGLIDMSGVSTPVFYLSGNSSVLSNAVENFKLRSGLRAVVGSGTSAEDFLDYALDSQLSLSLNTSVTTGADGGKILTYINITGTNTTGSAITISEIGIYKPIVDNTNSYPTPKNVLLVRTLLDEPIAVPANDTFNLLYTWVQD